MSRVELYREDASGIEIPAHYRRADFVPKPVWGKWRWRFVSNGYIMADSGQGYSRRVDALNGCVAVLGALLDGDELSRWPGGKPIQRIPVVDLTREATS